MGTARRGPPLHPRGLRGRVGAFGVGVRDGAVGQAGAPGSAPTAARPCLRSPPRRVDRLLCGAPGVRGVREWAVPVCVLAPSHRGGK